MFLDHCVSAMKYRCLQMFLLSAMFVCAPTQVVGLCQAGTTFTALPVVTSPSVGTNSVKIDCVTTPANQPQCFWHWQYSIDKLWGVVTSNSSGPSTGYYILPTGSLLISRVKQVHGATYMCMNPGTALAKSVSTVLYLQAQLSNVTTKDICVEIGSNGSFSFLAMGFPAPSLALYKQVQNVWSVVTDRRFVLNQSSVLIASAQLLDSSVYSIRANISVISSFAELQFTVRVTGNGAPRATLLPTSSTIVARESETLSITCSIQNSAFLGLRCDGYPVKQATAINWTRNGVAIQDSKQGLYAMTNLSAGVSILKSDYLVSKLSGQYTCEASNTQGSNSVSTTLQVYKPCDVNPCLNGGTCIITDKSGQALCLCSKNNSGDYCENTIIKRIYMGEFQIGAVIMWELSTLPQWSVQLRISNDSGVLFLINMQYNNKWVVFSSPFEDVLGYEEKVLDFPFALFNESIVIVAEENGFTISSNGTAFEYLYEYRGMPSGNIIISTTYGTVAIGKKLIIASYQPGTVIYVQGVAPESGDFAIQLYAADARKLTVPLSADIALSIKPRFNESTVILNSLITGHWGIAQVERALPLEASKPFICAITWQLYGYEIALNGVHFTTYNHRLPFTMTATVMASSLDYVYGVKLF